MEMRPACGPAYDKMEDNNFEFLKKYWIKFLFFLSPNQGKLSNDYINHNKCLCTITL
jgi:hypothetical protein